MALNSFGSSNHHVDFGQRKRKTFTGWKVAATMGSVLAMLVLTINTSLTIWVSLKRPIGKDGSINILSTILLSASNFCMQVLSAPTRAEIDQQHSRWNWMDIGLPSVRNLRKIARPRVVTWYILGLSSVPLHLLYNSAVFTTIRANELHHLIVAPDFLEGGNWTEDVGHGVSAADFFRIATTNTSYFQRLDRTSCIRTYDVEFITAGGDVIVVGTAHNSSNSLFSAMFRGNGIDFLRDCEMTLYENGGGDIAYCLSRPVDNGCDLQFSLHIMIIIIFCNLVKSITMGITIWKLRTPTLVTVGDAVSSFLEVPDIYTEGMCLTTKADILKGAWRGSRMPKAYRPVRNFWFRAASTRRWLICNALCLGTLGVAGFLLSMGIGSLGITASGGIDLFKQIYKMGLGTVTSSSMLAIGPSSAGPWGILANVLLANAAQLVLSFLYLTYNGLFTCMLNANEWSRYAHQRKGLRVTSPVGHQRSTYYLQLPYAYALPLQAICGILHWLVSQCIFLARVKWIGRDGTLEKITSRCGYSCIAIVFVIITGIIVVFGGIAMGFRRYPPGMPLAAGCSAAISAACHPPPSERENAASLPLKWGVVLEENCSFSADLVGKPVEGNQYPRGARKRRAISSAW